MSGIVFLDTETTGLDPATEDVFEVAIIRDDDEEAVWHIPPRSGVVAAMHPKAAEVNRYHERTADPGWRWHEPHKVLHALFDELDGVHICGAVPDFDTRHLTSLYQRFGMQPPRWHYHLIDIEAMAVGFLLGGADRLFADDEHRVETLSLPWKSDDLSGAIGVEPPADEERHTALGDARWVKRMYDAMTGVA